MMGMKVLLNLLKLRIKNKQILTRQTMSAKIHSQKGNSPD
jgi:hypothetical protein